MCEEKTIDLGIVDYHVIKSLVANIKQDDVRNHCSSVGMFLMNISGRGLIALVSEQAGVYHIVRIGDECPELTDRVIKSGFGSEGSLPSDLTFGAWKRRTGKRRSIGTRLTLVPHGKGMAELNYGGDTICFVKESGVRNRVVLENLLSGRRIGTRLREKDAGIIGVLAKADWDELDPMHSVDVLAGPAHVSIKGGRLNIERLAGEAGDCKPVASASVMCLVDGLYPGTASADFAASVLSSLFKATARNNVVGLYFIQAKSVSKKLMMTLMAVYEDGSSRVACEEVLESRPKSTFKPCKPLFKDGGMVIEPNESKKETKQEPTVKKETVQQEPKKKEETMSKDIVTVEAEVVKAKPVKPVVKKTVKKATEKPVDSGWVVVVVPSLIKAKDIPELKGLRIKPLRDGRRRKVGYVGHGDKKLVLVWRQWFYESASESDKSTVLKGNRVKM